MRGGGGRRLTDPTVTRDDPNCLTPNPDRQIITRLTHMCKREGRGSERGGGGSGRERERERERERQTDREVIS